MSASSGATDPTGPTGASRTLEGRLEVRVVDPGSHGEMTAAVLVLEDRVVALRRAGAVRLDAEPELATYDGLRVRVVGHPAWRTFVVETITTIEAG